MIPSRTVFPKKGSKYLNKKVRIDGILFDSKKESYRYIFLKGQVEMGDISNLELQPRFDIHVNGKYIAFYKADFRYEKDGKIIVEDVKSPATAKKSLYRLKKKLVEAIHNITILET